MPIRFQCAVCKHGIKVPDGAEGKRTRCPKCQALQQVPGAEEDEFRLKEPLDPDPPRKRPEPKPAPIPLASPEALEEWDEPEPNEFFADPNAPELIEARSEAAQKMKVPALAAIGTLGVGLLATLAYFFYIVATILSQEEVPGGMGQQVFLLAWTVCAMTLQGFGFFGLKQAHDLGNYGLAWAGFAVAGLPCSNLCCILSAPFCVWGMVLLADDSIQRHFRK